MKHTGISRFLANGAFLLSAFLAPAQTPVASHDTKIFTIDPSALPRIGSVDERFQSYNIEMVEVTGGRFWRPYASKAAAAGTTKPSGNQPAGMDPSLYEYRPPIDLSNARLRKLAAALGPAYLRVSGTWANTTFFQNSDQPVPASPPQGFKGVLTRSEWKGVIDFSRAVNAQLVTSFAISAGTRDPSGLWTPQQAEQIVAYTKSIGGSIAAAEFMNEPNIAEIGGAPHGYDAAAYGRDVQIFRAFAKRVMPDMIFLGPGTVGEGTLMNSPTMHMVSSADLFKATGPAFDAVSYHSYGAVSSRCGMLGGSSTTTADAALSAEWLDTPRRIEAFYAGVRDRFEPGKPLWNTETAQAACGGDKWASTFLDTFRYLNQLGVLSKLGVQVNLHNTLAASDYGLLDENTHEPRPDYWAALLWRRLMGTTVLDAGAAPSPDLHIFAHCLRSKPGRVALLVINASHDMPQTTTIPAKSDRYTLAATDLLDKKAILNGNELQLGQDDEIPRLEGAPIASGSVTFAPATITFLAVSGPHNAACQ